MVCRSAARRAKEEAIRERFLTRIDEALTTMAHSLERARKRWERTLVERRIGRMLERNRRAGGAFRIEVRDDPDRASGLRLVWERDAAWMAAAKERAGCYVLRTNVVGETAGSLWQMYIQLTDVEAAFRTAKTDLAIRPIWHQIERRVKGHILFSFLAYAMWKTLEGWLERAGLGRGSARTLLAELARLKAMDVVLPTTTGRKVRLRCVPRPEPALAALLDRMGLIVPARLGRPAWVPMPETETGHVV